MLCSCCLFPFSEIYNKIALFFHINWALLVPGAGITGCGAARGTFPSDSSWGGVPQDAWERGMALGMLECDGRGELKVQRGWAALGLSMGQSLSFGHPGCSLGWLVPPGNLLSSGIPKNTGMNNPLEKTK